MNFIKQICNDLHVLRRVIPIEYAKIESYLANESAEKLINFLIVAEDHRYKYHIGFDLIAIFRSILKYIFMIKKKVLVP